MTATPLGISAGETLRRIEQKVNRIAIVTGFAPGYAAYFAAMKEYALGAHAARVVGVAVWLAVVIFVRYQFTNPNSI